MKKDLLDRNVITRRINDWPEGKIPMMNLSMGILHCPSCGCDNLHQEAVKIYDRSEDGKYCRLTVVDGEDVSSKIKKGLKNPSPRRQGLMIGFTCERCHDGFKWLAIIQHKGSTYLRWLKDYRLK